MNYVELGQKNFCTGFFLLSCFERRGCFSLLLLFATMEEQWECSLLTKSQDQWQVTYIVTLVTGKKQEEGGQEAVTNRQSARSLNGPWTRKQAAVLGMGGPSTIKNLGLSPPPLYFMDGERGEEKWKDGKRFSVLKHLQTHHPPPPVEVTILSDLDNIFRVFPFLPCFFSKVLLHETWNKKIASSPLKWETLPFSNIFFSSWKPLVKGILPLF